LRKVSQELFRTLGFLSFQISGNAHANSMLDLYGRRKMYGIELYIIIGAIIGILMSSSGEAHSLDMFNSLFAWRFVMGIGKRP
jgi:MFS family permease